ncbi:MAG: alpha/beta fold hydrolase [Spirochaetaceae bacterium]|jgi:alpha-beta hydrolase superfamily lysophospholipase|nr:alpha/beta fold hydrolase [Spirochaetaceae bacterium]
MRKIGVFLLCAGLPVLVSAQKRVEDFSLRGLQTYPYKASPITIQSMVLKNNLQYAYNVSFRSMDLTISARMSIPAIASENIKGMVIMLRGHQNPEGYYTGKGTENPARGYLQRGYAVIAPDFPGYGNSSPTPEPAELHQFYSTVNAVELYKSLENPDFSFAPSIPQGNRISLPDSFKKLVLWGHSNGGQVAIHFLEIIQKPVPTVLWAPVSIAFPDSLAHYRRRTAWAEQFKKEHSAADFSLFSQLHRIAPGTPVLLEQGDKDAAVPKAWSDAFAGAVGIENQRREKAGLGMIDLSYKVYKNANHNLNPYWNSVLPLDVLFWDQH